MYRSLILIAIVALVGTTAKAADENAPVLADYTYQYSANLEQRIADASALAIQQKKNLMLVFGAQWCHDSRGFAQQLSQPNVDVLIKQFYVPVFIDVATYRDLRWLTERYNYPGYFATPTVMVIEPVSKQLLNRDNMVLWNTADNVKQETYLEYFTHYANAENSRPEISNKQRELLQHVQGFAAQNTARLFAGFARLGPMMDLAFNDELNDFTELTALSEEVYAFRMQLQEDYHRLYALANDLSLNENIQFPTYGPFSWENSAVAN
ncbi:thioredoxin family protein [Alteromonas flava]|uniref:thioredoxin family protein n=1 Tax=Alteromonas flava TaxID=2048003 RepID=UPI000C2887E4|nr:thioredoxin family protein [Alteromonas flava]